MINEGIKDISHIMVNFLFGGTMKLILLIRVVKYGMILFHNMLRYLIYKVKLNLIKVMIVTCLSSYFNLNGSQFIQ